MSLAPFGSLSKDDVNRSEQQKDSSEVLLIIKTYRTKIKTGNLQELKSLLTGYH
jgi:hypothetical protein